MFSRSYTLTSFTISTLQDLEAIAGKLNPAVGYFDPLDLAGADFWDQGNEATIGFLRHSEIKHGRVAMAAFVGYIVHANGIRFPWPQVGGGVTIEGNNPPEMWDQVPMNAKLQMAALIFFLEWSVNGSVHQPHAEIISYSSLCLGLLNHSKQRQADTRDLIVPFVQCVVSLGPQQVQRAGWARGHGPPLHARRQAGQVPFLQQ